MKLKPYLEKMGIDRKAFSEQSDIPLPTVYRLLDEPERVPDGNTIAKIVKATNGAVGLFDLVENHNAKASTA
jgi:predicted transcriptional regulator